MKEDVDENSNLDLSEKGEAYIFGKPTLLAGAIPLFTYLGSKQLLLSRENYRKLVISRQKGLVIFQFSISIILVVSVFIVSDQIEYIKNKNLGFNRYNVISFQPIH